MAAAQQWTRFVALGDSFTEGIGDPEPRSPGGHRGWADRVAEVLAAGDDGFAYANLAVRGRLLRQILDEQLEPALALAPDLVSVSAGGNDIIRPGTDPDELSARLEEAIARLAGSGATVALFTGPDVGGTPVMGIVRGKAAVYNENLRAIAQRHGSVVVDLWAATELRDPRMWADDRLHFSPVGHQAIARRVLDALGVAHGLQPWEAEPLPLKSWRQARLEDAAWAREHFAPWVVRRLKGTSSGDGVGPKRPTAGPVGDVP